VASLYYDGDYWQTLLRRVRDVVESNRPRIKSLPDRMRETRSAGIGAAPRGDASLFRQGGEIRQKIDGKS
jgi:hypothetical protein